jgi:hypothetical protein
MRSDGHGYPCPFLFVPEPCCIFNLKAFELLYLSLYFNDLALRTLDVAGL